LLTSWRKHIAEDGWIALTEVDDLFGHEPLSARTSSLLHSYAQDAISAGRYDFRMGGKLSQYLNESGYLVSRVLVLPDEELSFNGPGKPDVINAWRRRFERMNLLRTFCGSDFAKVEEEFLLCLGRTDHVSTARVVACIATPLDHNDSPPPAEPR
jgi:hypothetical protein